MPWTHVALARGSLTRSRLCVPAAPATLAGTAVAEVGVTRQPRNFFSDLPEVRYFAFREGTNTRPAPKHSGVHRNQRRRRLWIRPQSSGNLEAVIPGMSTSRMTASKCSCRAASSAARASGM